MVLAAFRVSSGSIPPYLVKLGLGLGLGLGVLPRLTILGEVGRERLEGDPQVVRVEELVPADVLEIQGDTGRYGEM